MARNPPSFRKYIGYAGTDYCHYFTGVSELVSASKNNK